MMSLPLKMTFSLGVLASLAACGGSTSTVPITQGVPAFASAQAATDQGRSRLAAIEGLDLTPPSSFRTSGRATYEGSIVLNDQSSAIAPSASVIGGMAINIDFANADNVTGTAGNFFDAQANRVSGTLDLSNVIFDQGTSGGGLVGDLDGTLQDVAGSADYTYDLELGAIYFGPNTEALLGFISGTATAGSGPRRIEGATVLE